MDKDHHDALCFPHCSLSLLCRSKRQTLNRAPCPPWPPPSPSNRRRPRPPRSKWTTPSSPPRRAAPPRRRNRPGVAAIDLAVRSPPAPAAAVRARARRCPASFGLPEPFIIFVVSTRSSGPPLCRPLALVRRRVARHRARRPGRARPGVGLGRPGGRQPRVYARPGARSGPAKGPAVSGASPACGPACPDWRPA